MMKMTVQRSMLTHTTQTWHVDIPDDLAVYDWHQADPSAFDEHVCDTGDLVAEDTTFDVDNDGLENQILCWCGHEIGPRRTFDDQVEIGCRANSQHVWHTRSIAAAADTVDRHTVNPSATP